MKENQENDSQRFVKAKSHQTNVISLWQSNRFVNSKGQETLQISMPVWLLILPSMGRHRNNFTGWKSAQEPNLGLLSAAHCPTEGC